MQTEVRSRTRILAPSPPRPLKGRVRKTLVTSILCVFVLLVPNLSLGSQASTKETSAEICRSSAQFASAETGVPFSILMAISLTETGRKKGGSFDPWPWTVNMEGAGKWFETRKSAYDYVNKNFDRGARSFDVGCFQINYKWHGKAFASIQEMFEPNANAIYAAHYLLALFEEHGSWDLAVGAYHSRTPKYANKYRKRFAAIHAGLTGQTALPSSAKAEGVTPARKPRINKYPLLRAVANAVAKNGSLVLFSNDSEPRPLLTSASGRFF